MSLVEKLKLETRISQKYRHLLHLVNAPSIDPNIIAILEQAIEQDYEQLNKLHEPPTSDTSWLYTTTR